MSKAQWLTPEQLKDQHPTVFEIFFMKNEPKPKPKILDGAPDRSKYKSGRDYAKAMAEWIKSRNVKMKI